MTIAKSSRVKERFLKLTARLKPRRSFIWYAVGFVGTTGFFWRWAIGKVFIFPHGSMSRDLMEITSLTLSALSFVLGRWESASKKSKDEVRAEFKKKAEQTLTPATRHFIDLQKSVNNLGQWKKKVHGLIERTNSHQQELQTLESIQDNADFSQIAEFAYCLDAILIVIGHLYAIQEDESNNTHISRGQLSQEIGVVIRELIRLTAIVKR